jgi:hypothetical protein
MESRTNFTNGMVPTINIPKRVSHDAHATEQNTIKSQ